MPYRDKIKNLSNNWGSTKERNPEHPESELNPEDVDFLFETVQISIQQDNLIRQLKEEANKMKSLEHSVSDHSDMDRARDELLKGIEQLDSLIAEKSKLVNKKRGE